MKRQYVIPDLLASLTADALFGERVPLRPDQPGPAKPGTGALKRLAIWVRTNGAPISDCHQPATGASNARFKDKQ